MSAYTDNTGMIGSVEHSLTLDMDKSGVQGRIRVRQGDALIHRITVTVKKSGSAYIPRGAETVELYGALPSGESVTCGGEITDGGKITFLPGGGFFRHGGPVICRICVRGGDGSEFYSPSFAVDADPMAHSTDDAVPAEAYSGMEKLLLEVLAVKRRCEEIAEEILNSGPDISFGEESPLMDGTASAGVSDSVARADHVHPSDGTKMPAIDKLSTFNTLSVTDLVPFYDSSEKLMRKTRIGSISNTVKNAIVSVKTSDKAKGLIPASGDDTFIATVPALTADATVALTSDIDALRTELLGIIGS